MSPASAQNRFQLVVTPEFMERVENWRRKQPKIPNVSEAIRQLVEKGLEAS